MGKGHGFVHWNELLTRDAEQQKKFYADTLGWSYDKFGDDYWVIKQDGEPVGGIFTAGEQIPKDVPEHWMTYIHVDDVDTRLDKAKSAGAVVMREPFEVPQVGRIAILRQPGGAVIGWITPAQTG